MVDPTSDTAARLSTREVVVLVACVVLCRIAAIQACPTYDDAFITYRYASNFAAGRGLVFNPGEPWEPVLGTTTVLYTLVMSAFARLGADLVTASLVFNLACDAASACLVARLLGRRRVASATALLAFAALPQLVRISVGGMESPLFLLGGLTAVACVESRRPACAGIAAAATCLVRPEGVLLALVLCVSLARRPRELVRFAVPVLAIGVVAIATLSAVYGTPIPQSVSAKRAMQGPDAERERAERLARILSEAFLPARAYLALVPFVAIGAWRAWRAGGAVRLFSLWALGITASYVVARPHTWGWYFCVPLAGWIVWLALGIEAAWAQLASRRAPIVRALVGAVERGGPIVAAIVLAPAAFVVARARPSPIQAQVYAPMWKWAAETSAAEPRARILASDIGAIGHAWRGTVLDSEGLVWPEALRWKTPLAIIEQREPEYLLVVAERPRLRHLAERPDLMAHYEPIARFDAKGESRLVVAPEDVPLAWSQDYLVYRRRR